MSFTIDHNLQWLLKADMPDILVLEYHLLPVKPINIVIALFVEWIDSKIPYAE
jgi:hypothetical protein